MELDNITRDIYNYIKDEMNHSKEFEMDTNIVERGLIDSTGILTLVLFLETKYNIEIELEDINGENFMKIATIAQLVKKLLG